MTRIGWIFADQAFRKSLSKKEQEIYDQYSKISVNPQNPRHPRSIPKVKTYFSNTF